MQTKKRRIESKSQSTLTSFFTVEKQTKKKSVKVESIAAESIKKETVKEGSEQEKSTKADSTEKSSVERKAVKEESVNEVIRISVQEPVKLPERDLVEREEEEEQKEKEEVVWTNSIYTEEFNRMITTVLEGESYLFDEKELDLFHQFSAFEDAPRDLIVRLLMRKHRWVKQNSLHKYPITDIDQTCRILSDSGWIEREITDIEIALSVLTKQELKNIAKERHINIQEEKNPRKSDYEKEILNYMSSKHISYGNTHAFIESKAKKLWDTVNQYLGPCVYVRSHIYTLFQRLQIVYYRATSLYDTNYVSQSILAKISKRNYPQYICSRSNSIWSCREDLLRFEEALLVEKQFEETLQNLPGLKRIKTWSRKERTKEETEEILLSGWSLCETKIGLWDECICSKQKDLGVYYKRRFEAGWIYTRLLDRGTEILAKLREYQMESLILHKLLSQRVYRLGKRGKWYERLALIQMNYLEKNDAKAVRDQKKCALQTCIDALHDTTVHQIFLPGIQERIKRLERQLCIPKREQHDFSYMCLKKPREIIIYGERLSEEVLGKKSIWRTNNGAECSVEQVALEYYSTKGFKGLHAENGIIRMIASLLFWDVIFASIPGVFETPYQTEPLDLRSDAFYESRFDIIKERLNEIENGNYLEMIRSVDEREREKQTMCTGINWNYELQDILEIAECIGPSSLASLCKLLFEEYGQRQSGMPDLW
ncbi:hypothetical protein G6F16_002647 [Rhizopus arrhizus]|nr:hypothetical protein G6F24_000657 [Rhizopus arrhizus]KAG0793384.1 hypothetical protein G6F21_003655 [Rhizopus arrhizus]KAG0799311.1 hypothetical protein G6F22_003353 [Rhizopus arrhizus]KAG0815080.1 hypothetical protein G6F20_004268 [Rhizopus arrhizus]KAG0834999.1 hypothetical protein G6F19_004919 [Rhizopus arrhizus]